jgi:hypothetical protein
MPKGAFLKGRRNAFLPNFMRICLGFDEFSLFFEYAGNRGFWSYLSGKSSFGDVF